MKRQRGFTRQLVYYPRLPNGELKTRPRVANYTRMDHCGGIGMAYESERLRTFFRWTNENITPAALARAGFFSIDSLDTDRVQCAFCRGKLVGWEKGDDPAKGHRRFYSTCPFVLNMDVGNIPMRGRGICPETLENPSVVKNSALKKLTPSVQASKRSYYSVPDSKVINIEVFTKANHLSKQEKLARLDSWCVRKALELEFPVEIIHHITLHLHKFDGESIFFLDFILQCAQQLEEHIKSQLMVRKYSPAAYSDWLLFLEREKQLLKEQQALQLNELRKRIEDQPDLLGRLFNELKLTKVELPLSSNKLSWQQTVNEVVKHEQCCKVCFNETIAVVFIPCHHFIVCNDCGNKLSSCPLCRLPVESHLVVNYD